MAQESWKCDQDETGCQPPEGPILCANNCGFFGSKATMNLCSKCYRDVVLSQAKASSAKNALEQLPPLLINKEPSSDSAPPAAPPSSGGSSSSEAAILEMKSTSSSGASTPISAPSPGAAGGHEPSASRPPNRCFACNKRVGLTGFNCRCGNVYCSLHRYSDKHNCTFDYKSVGRDAIAKANPVVKADKIDKI